MVLWSLARHIIHRVWHFTKVSGFGRSISLIYWCNWAVVKYHQFWEHDTRITHSNKFSNVETPVQVWYLHVHVCVVERWAKLAINFCFFVLTWPGRKFNIKTWGVCKVGRSELPFHNAIIIIFEVLSVLTKGMSVVIMVLNPGY